MVLGQRLLTGEKGRARIVGQDWRKRVLTLTGTAREEAEQEAG